MIGRVTLAFLLSCFALSPGISNDAALAAADENCTALSKVKAQLPDGATLTALTPGQWNFLRGFYLGAPPTMQGKIPGTGAALLERKGAKGGMIVWTLNTLACRPFPVPAEFIAALKGSKTGPLDEDGNEL